MQTTPLSSSPTFTPNSSSLSPPTAPHIPMEERVMPPPPPPPPPPPQDHADMSQLQLADFSSGTYVVQVPKDHVYRVPPEENARIAELHQNTRVKDTKKARCCCCCSLFIIVLLIAIFIFTGLLGGLFSIVLKPKDPRFSIQGFMLESKPRPLYKITLQVHNPNSKLDISYKEGGDASLFLRRQKIGSGTYPTFSQTHHNSTELGVTLKGSKGGLPKEVDESMKHGKSKKHVSFSLTIHVKARMKMGLLRSGKMKYDVTCQLTVDTLAKTTHVVAQQCETKRH